MKQRIANRFFEGVTSSYKLILAVSIGLIVLGAICIPLIHKDTRYEAFLPEDDTVLNYKNKVEETFGLSDPMVIAVVNENGIFNAESLKTIHELSEALKKIPGIDPDRITSLSTENNIIGTTEGLLVEPFFEIESLTEESALLAKSAINDFELYLGSLVSKDHTTTLVLAEMLDAYSMKQHEVYRDIDAMLQEYKGGGDQLYLAGEGAVSGYLIKYIDEDAMRTNPFAGLVIALILIVAYRTRRGVVIPNIMVLASVGIALGLMAFMDVSFYVITNGLPVVLIAIAVADGIHILGEYYEGASMHPEYNQQELVVHTMERMWRPVTITSITTIAGFLAISFSSYMPPMIYFGVFGAVGVLIALIYALLFIPAAMMLLKPQMSRYFLPNKLDGFAKMMQFVGNWVVRYPKLIATISLAIILIGGIGASQLRINEDRVKNFQKSEPIVLADQLINDKTEGTSYLDVSIETAEAEDIFKPANLKKMEAFQDYLEQLEHVEGSTSIVDFLKKMNQSLNENDPNYYTIPESQELAAQYLLLYSASGDPTDFDNYVDYDYRLANIRFRMNSGEYVHEKEVVKAANEYIEKEFNGDAIQATLSGKVAVDAHWIGKLGMNHFVGAGVALFIVAIVAALSFRSFTAGLLTVLPVTVSVLFIYAVMGLFDIWLAVGTSMFAAIAIGVGVDFSVHTIDRFKFFMNDLNMPMNMAFSEFYKSTGRALLFNFLALTLGFGVLMTSTVPPLNDFGFLVAVAVTGSALASLTLLPSIIYLVKPRFLKRNSR